MSDLARSQRPGGPQRIPRPETVTVGAGAWWSQVGSRSPKAVPLECVREAFAAERTALRRARDARGPRDVDAEARPEVADSVLDRPAADRRQRDARLPMGDPGPSAVLCALFQQDGETWVVLTRRSARLRSHTGEVAFPGGRLDPGEAPLAAALREADEEVGIAPEDVEVIGRLAPLATMSSWAAISPFVGVLPAPPHLRPNPAEVDRAFCVPLSELMAPGVYHEERWALPGGGGERSVHFFDLPGETVWGATAKMLRDLLDLIFPVPG